MMNVQIKAGLVFITVLIAGCSTESETATTGKIPADTKRPQTSVVDKIPADTKRSQDVKHCENIEQILKPIVASMVAQKIPYSQDPANEWRDCSGNFLRLSSYVATQCPGVELVAPPGITDYAKGGDNKAPGEARSRTTRGIAKWYDGKGVFTPIYYDDTDLDQAPAALVANRNKIKPGTVLWFSRKKPVKADGKISLYKEAGGMINHMATVVKITKDDRGNVTGWDMYHGQNPKKGSGVTSHWWDWPAKYTSRGQQYPPGGFWSQRIVGIAESLIPHAQ
ncbi:MAG: hypothetical protein OEU26_34130 [Candidatus Tectomicrobia bacterium]|nr:hypothetical protein [Candidatus Tectomicrobia bacterium]